MYDIKEIKSNLWRGIPPFFQLKNCTNSPPSEAGENVTYLVLEPVLIQLPIKAIENVTLQKIRWIN